MVMPHAGIALWHHFHPWITKNMGLETVFHLATPITENRKIVPKIDPRRLPKSTPKSMKMDIWASVCPLGVPLDPRITKTVFQVPKKDPQGSQNDHFKLKKWSIVGSRLLTRSGQNQHGCVNCPGPNSPCHLSLRASKCSGHSIIRLHIYIPMQRFVFICDSKRMCIYIYMCICVYHYQPKFWNLLWNSGSLDQTKNKHTI